MRDLTVAWLRGLTEFKMPIIRYPIKNGLKFRIESTIEQRDLHIQRLITTLNATADLQRADPKVVFRVLKANHSPHAIILVIEDSTLAAMPTGLHGLGLPTFTNVIVTNHSEGSRQLTSAEEPSYDPYLYIRERAYYLWLENPHSCHLENWHQATIENAARSDETQPTRNGLVDLPSEN